MTTLTKIAEVCDALETAVQAAVASQGIAVYRGGSWAQTSDTVQEFVLIGSDGSVEGDGVSGVEEQEPAGMGGGWRTARGDVTCAVICQSGDPAGIVGRRARAEAVLDLIDAGLRPNPNLSGVIQFGWISGAAGYETVNAAGIAARYVWTYHYEVDL